MSDLFVTLVGGAIWFLMVLLSVVGTGRVMQRLGVREPFAAFLAMIIGVLVAVLLAFLLVAFMDRLFARFSRQKPE